MAFPKPHNYLVCFGDTLNAGQPDIWQFGLRLVPPGDSLDAEMDATGLDQILDDIETDLGAWWTSMSLRFANSTRFLGFKFNGIDVEGRYADASRSVVRDFNTPKVGTASGAVLPSQVALAVTLETAAQRGLASKGRIYLPPMTSSVLDVGGLVVEATRDAIQTATATLLTNLNNWPGIDATYDPGTVSVGSKVGAGQFRPVTGVTVGKRMDVQRRRANKVRELRDPASPVT